MESQKPIGLGRRKERTVLHVRSDLKKLAEIFENLIKSCSGMFEVNPMFWCLYFVKYRMPVSHK